MARKAYLCLLALLLCTSPLVRSEDAKKAEDAEDDYEDTESFRAHLIVHKDLAEKASGELAYPLVVQGRNATIAITIQNVGTGTASNVVLTDMLPANAQLLDGDVATTFAKIAPGSSVTHKYTIVFTSGGSMDLTFLPVANVKYTAEEDSQQTGYSTKAGVFVLTPVQQITRYALIAGSYASLGICRTPTEWRNMAILLGVVGSILGANWGVKQFKSSSSTSRRKKALQELEKNE